MTDLPFIQLIYILETQVQSISSSVWKQNNKNTEWEIDMYAQKSST